MMAGLRTIGMAAVIVALPSRASARDGLEGPRPDPPAASVEHQAAVRWKRRDQLLLDGVVFFAVLANLSLASMMTGVIMMATAPEQPGCFRSTLSESPCGQVPTARWGRVFLYTGGLTAIPIAAGLGTLAHRLKLHRQHRPPLSTPPPTANADPQPRGRRDG